MCKVLLTFLELPQDQTAQEETYSYQQVGKSSGHQGHLRSCSLFKGQRGVCLTSERWASQDPSGHAKAWPKRTGTLGALGLERSISRSG